MPSKISFYLKEPTSEAETLLFAFVYVKRDQKFKISTGIKLHPNDWNTSKQIVKKTHTHVNNLNELLKKIRANYENICLQAEIHGKQLTKEYLQHNSRFTNAKTETSSNFFRVYDLFLNAKKNHCAANSLKKYSSIKRHLENFAKAKNYNLNFQTMDFDFHEKFTDYLLHDVVLAAKNPKKTTVASDGSKKGMYNHSASKVVKFVKTFLNYAFDNGFHENLNYKKWKPLSDNSAEIIALSSDELKRIEELQELPGYLEKTRNLFLILCYTGIRFSDLKNVNGSNIKDGFISITTQKTKEAIKLPMHRKLIKLLERVTTNGVVKIEEISNQKMNAYLKDIGKLAELNEKCFKVRYKGGHAVPLSKDKWELLTTHTGRRTFTTLSLYLGMDSESVKKITGHKSDASFKKYVRYSDQQLKEKIKVWD